MPTVLITNPCRFLVWVDAGFSTCREVTEHLDGVSYAALVWINPVFTCEGNAVIRPKQHSNPTCFSSRSL